MTRTALLSVGAAALSLASLGGVLLVLRGGGSREVQARLRGLAGDVAPDPAKAGPRPRDIRRTDSRSPLARVWSRLGRSPHVPKDYRLSFPVLVGFAFVAAVAAGYFCSILANPLASPAAALVAGALAVHALFRWEQQRYRQKLFVQIPEALGLILRAIRAGLPMAEAVTNVAREVASPTREEFARLAGEITIGRPVDVALFSLAERTGLTEYFFFAVTVGLQAQTGGSLGETLENLAEMVRKRVSLAAKVKAMTAEARMSASILTGLPFCAGGAIALLAPGHLTPLFRTDQGFQLLMIGVGLLVTGLLTIRTLLRSAVKD